jgi:hypothetical protein
MISERLGLPEEPRARASRAGIRRRRHTEKAAGRCSPEFTPPRPWSGRVDDE